MMLRHTQLSAIALSLCTVLGCGGTESLPDLDDAQRDLTSAVAVFPGAEGFGTDTPAGRGGDIVWVTNLDDDGPGSLRVALRTEGPRTILFEVGGVIQLERRLDVTEPFVTVAGQSAPAPGITLVGAALSIQTHDVLVQHLAARPGDGPGQEPEDRDGVQVRTESGVREDVYNVVVDHVSMTWAIDEGFSTWTPGVEDVTLSHCLVAETLNDSLHPGGPHSKAILIGDHTRRVAVLRNVIAHNRHRNPELKGDSTSLVVGNLIYNPGFSAIGAFDPNGAGPLLSTILDNEIRLGPSSESTAPAITVWDDVPEGSHLWFDANVTDGDVVSRDDTGRDDVFIEEAPVWVSPLTRSTAPRDALLAHVGSRGAERDPNDARIIDSIRSGTGRIIDAVEEVGFVRPAAQRARPTLPPRPLEDDDGDGYTNLEGWLHQRAEEVSGWTGPD
ncbi:MAG: right-handed parallel beta-helix repeat-containing protein [Sandaracinaceae bacterium]